MELERYTTSPVGAHSVPRWYEMLEQQVEVGELEPDEMADAQYRANQPSAGGRGRSSSS